MAAPTPTTRQDPAGIKMENGYRALITLAADSDVSFWEIEVTPPALNGGDEIDTTTMHNDTVRTKSPRTLYDLGETSVVAAYDPNVYNNILSNLLNVKTTITITFYDGSTLAYYGYLKDFEPDALVEGEMPQATITIVATNFDPTNRVEAVPVLTSVAGS